MKIGDFRYWTDNRGVAACLATMGVPFKNPVPIVNEYTPEHPKPQVPCGHPQWRPGQVKWCFDALTDKWTSEDKPIMPKRLTAAYFNSKAADAFGERIEAVDAAFKSKDIAAAQLAWKALKNDLPFVLAGYMGKMIQNYLLCWLPMLKKAWTQTSIPSGQGHIHLSINPSDTVKNAFL